MSGARPVAVKVTLFFLLGSFVANVDAWIDLGQRTMHDAPIWVGEWAHASGSSVLASWSAIGLASIVLLCVTFDQDEDWMCGPALAGVFLALLPELYSFYTFIPAEARLLSWTSACELAGLVVVAGGIGRLTVSLLVWKIRLDESATTRAPPLDGQAGYGQAPPFSGQAGYGPAPPFSGRQGSGQL